MVPPPPVNKLTEVSSWEVCSRSKFLRMMQRRAAFCWGEEEEEEEEEEKAPPVVRATVISISIPVCPPPPVPPPPLPSQTLPEYSDPPPPSFHPLPSLRIHPSERTNGCFAFNPPIASALCCFHQFSETLYSACYTGDWLFVAKGAKPKNKKKNTKKVFVQQSLLCCDSLSV